MIQKSFIFLDGIGIGKEKNIWRQGISNWDDFLKAKSIRGISKRRKSYYDRKIKEARSHLYNQNSYYFINKLPSNETWRLYDYFKEEAVFLDIETSGAKGDLLTVVGLFDGIDTKVMINSINLDFRALKEELAKYKLIITFNGACFDLPFLRKYNNNLLPKIPHIDLRFLCRRVGMSGGLKKIEKDFNVQRAPIINNLYGGDALTLWKMYRASGDEYYLDLLIEYNEEDVINLKQIANVVVRNLTSNFSALQQNFQDKVCRPHRTSLVNQPFPV